MTPIEEILLAIVTILAGALISYYFWVRHKLEEKEKESRTLSQNFEDQKKLLEEQDAEIKKYENIKEVFKRDEKIASVLATLKSKRFKDLILRTLDSLSDGIVKLTGDDYFRFWTDLHTAKDVIFFRVTSRIDPRLWKTDEMKAYQERQIENIKAFNSKFSKKEKEGFAEKIEKRLGEKVQGNFERLFIVDSTQLGRNRVVRALAETIYEQKKHISIKALRISPDEKPVPSKPQDFGILITENGDALLMDLELSDDWEPAGGRVIFDPDKIRQYWDYYKAVEAKSRKI